MSEKFNGAVPLLGSRGRVLQGGWRIEQTGDPENPYKVATIDVFGDRREALFSWAAACEICRIYGVQLHEFFSTPEVCLAETMPLHLVRRK